MSRWSDYRRKMSDSRESQWQSSRFWGSKVKGSQANWEKKERKIANHFRICKWGAERSKYVLAVDIRDKDEEECHKVDRTDCVKAVIPVEIQEYANLDSIFCNKQSNIFHLRICSFTEWNTVWLIPIISYKCLNLQKQRSAYQIIISSYKFKTEINWDCLLIFWWEKEAKIHII